MLFTSSSASSLALSMPGPSILCILSLGLTVSSSTRSGLSRSLGHWYKEWWRGQVLEAPNHLGGYGIGGCAVPIPVYSHRWFGRFFSCFRSHNIIAQRIKNSSNDSWFIIKDFPPLADARGWWLQENSLQWIWNWLGHGGFTCRSHTKYSRS